MKHSKNCAIFRQGDIRAWCDCGAIRRARIKLVIFELLIGIAVVAALWAWIYFWTVMAV